MKSNENEIRRLKRKIEWCESHARLYREQVLTLEHEDAKTAEERAGEAACKRKANRLAKLHDIPIENNLKTFDNIAVWAPEKLDTELKDPHHGDHFVYSWGEALKRVETYVKELTK